MPRDRARICNTPGCPEFAHYRGKCKGCQDAAEQARGGTAAQRGYDWRWSKRARSFLRRHPACAGCGGRATVADHVIQRKVLIEQGVSDPDADRHLQPLCKRCHGRKSAEEHLRGR